MKSATNPKIEYEGKQIGGKSVFPDWYVEETKSWWINELESFNTQVPLSGVWLDMNEPSTFCHHSCNPDTDFPSKSLQNKMFYIPGGDLNS